MLRIERYVLSWNHHNQATGIQLLLQNGQITNFTPRDAAELAAVAAILATGQANLMEDGTIITAWV